MRTALRSILAVALLGAAGHACAENLGDVLKQADDNDPQWKATAASLDARREVLAQGRSGVLPTVVLSGERLSNDVKDNNGGGTDSYDSTQIVLRATQPLLHFDRWFQYQSARAARSQVDAEYVAAEQDYLVRVTQTYFDVLRAAEQLAYARAEEAALSRQLEQAKQRFNVGLIAITDVHETQAAYDLAEVGLIVANTNLSVARSRLETLTGKHYSSLSFPGEDMPVVLPDPQGADTWADKAREGNAQLLAARQAARAAQQNARSATSGMMPTIDLVAQRVDYSTTYFFGPVPTKSDTTTDSVGIQAQWPLFAGGAINSKRKQANSQADAAQENLRAAELNATEGARTQYRVVEADVLNVAARKQATVSAQSALDATNAGYEVGTRNVVDVLQAQRNTFAARRDYANARYDYILDLLRLNQAAGALSHPQIIEASKWLNVTLSLDDGQPVAEPNAAVAPAANAVAPAPAAAPATAPAP